MIIILVLIVVGLAAAGVGSTIYAMRTIEERDRAREDFEASSSAVSRIVVAAATSGKLKGSAAAEDRESILKPALAYYQEMSQKHADNERMLPEFVSAKLHAATLQAKLGSDECLDTLNVALRGLNQMAGSDEFGAERFPAFQDTVLKITAPAEWFTIKTKDPMAHAVGLFMAIQNAQGAYRGLSKKFPESTAFRDDLSALLKSSAMLLTTINQRQQALAAWLEARDALETLVRDEPSNPDYQARLAESLDSAARIQRNSGETDKAIANLERAVEIRQKLADANPEDKSLAQAVVTVKRELERARTAPAPKKEAESDAPKQAEVEATPKKVANDEAPQVESDREVPKPASSEDPSSP